MSFTLRPHELKTRGGQTILVRDRPYLRLRQGEDPPIFVQGGKFYFENGQEVEELPDWVVEKLKQVNPEVRKQIGLEEQSKEAKPNGKS